MDTEIHQRIVQRAGISSALAYAAGYALADTFVEALPGAFDQFISAILKVRQQARIDMGLPADDAELSVVIDDLAAQ